MREVWTMTNRIMKLYLKNPLALIFSFVYMILIIALYGLFMGDYLTDGIVQAYTGVQGVELSSMRWLVDSNAMAGVLMINCILVPLNVLAIMVQDSDDRTLDSFLVSSVSRDKLVYGYWLAPFLVDVFMNILCLFIAEVFIVISGGQLLAVEATFKMIGLLIVNAFSSTSMLFLVAMFIKNASAYNTLTGILSALVGFITGAFIPIGVFPESIKKVFSIIPAHYGATAMREVMTKAPLDSVFGHVIDQTVKGAFMKAEEIANIYAEENGIIYILNGNKVGLPIMTTIIIGSGIFCLAISIYKMMRKKRIT